MNRLKRPNEAILPVAARPQFTHTIKRPRIDHLSKYARVRPGMTPCGLPNRPRTYVLETGTPGPSSKGHAYRNAVFQALLNTPMFVNFARMHVKRWSDSCPIKLQCLTCAMAHLAGWYWSNSAESMRRENVNHFCDELWNVCQNTFWPKSASTNRVGPQDLKDEFFSDTFLLHFLAEMRSQLECSPSEFQTFEKMFTVHTVRRWRCKTSKFCNWASAPYKWESSLHLNLSVQKPQANKRQTKVLSGIQRALQVPNRLASRRGSTIAKLKCDNCQRPVESVVEIDNLPEVLIVIRDTEELSPEDDPDIPYEPELNLQGLTSGHDSENDPKTYELVSGVGEYRYNARTSRNCAFARGAKDMPDQWFAMLDELCCGMTFDTLERSQRSEADGGLASSENLPLCPEIFIYRRKDYNNRTHHIDLIGPESPLEDIIYARDLVARSIHDIFTQKIGRGLLKFKVKVTPADPAPQDVIEVDLKMSYELDGKHYGIKMRDGKNLLGFQLHPLDAEDQHNFNTIVSPAGGEALTRALRRQKGIYPMSQEEGAEQIQIHAAQQGLPDPSATPDAGTRVGHNADTMDLDPHNPFNNITALGWDAKAQDLRKQITEASIGKIVDGYLLVKDIPSTGDGRKPRGSGSGRGGRGGTRGTGGGGGSGGRGRGGRGGSWGNNSTNDSGSNHGNHGGNSSGGRGSNWKRRWRGKKQRTA